MRKSQTTAFYFYFLYRKIYILLENKFGKTQFILLHLLYHFFHVAGYWKCINTNAHIDVHWFCRRHTSIQNTRQQSWFFNVDFDNNGLFLSFVYFRHIPSILIIIILIWAISFIIKSIRKVIEILAKRLFSFSIILFNMKFLVILFIRKINCQRK